MISVTLMEFQTRIPSTSPKLLSELPDGRLSYRSKTPWQNGTTAVIIEWLEFMERLASLIPVSRKNLIHYYGVLGPAAKWRATIVPAAAEIVSTPVPCGCQEERRSKARVCDARLLGKRGFRC
jgi:hypothetical protein